MKFAILLIFFYTNCALASKKIVTSSIDKIAQFIIEKKAEVGVDNILVVYDFDNTLMAMNQDIGSDQWYNWQSKLIAENQKSKDRVAKTMDELLGINSKIFALGRMHLVEKQTSKVVKEIQQMKIKSIVLTSRGYGLRNDLETELATADLEFKTSAFGPEGGYASTFLPDELENPRRVSYMDGLVMGSGQNKGKILKNILKKTNSKFKLIILVDDTLKNIENTEAEFKDEVELLTFYYTHEEVRVEKFKKDKSKAQREWQKFAPILNSVFEGP